MDHSFPMHSYAYVVKNTIRKKQTDTRTRPMTWFEQVEKEENDTMSRSNSMSTILSDDIAASCRRPCDHRNSISHSSDSGHVSDTSYDIETCLKSTAKQDADTCSTDTIERQKPSVDVCDTSHVYQKRANRDDKFERDEGVLQRRQKQIEYGKCTVGYKIYRKQISRAERKQENPQTPNKYLKYSRRAFDGLIKIWRRDLHKYDPANTECDSHHQSTMPSQD